MLVVHVIFKRKLKHRLSILFLLILLLITEFSFASHFSSVLFVFFIFYGGLSLLSSMHFCFIFTFTSSTFYWQLYRLLCILLYFYSVAPFYFCTISPRIFLYLTIFSYVRPSSFLSYFLEKVLCIAVLFSPFLYALKIPSTLLNFNTSITFTFYSLI